MQSSASTTVQREGKSMEIKTLEEGWTELMDFLKTKCSTAEFQNWLSPIHFLQATEEKVILEVPNVFVQEYFLTNYQADVANFLPRTQGKSPLEFVITERKQKQLPVKTPHKKTHPIDPSEQRVIKLNELYTFDKFIEGPSNQFVKSAAFGVATKPGKTYNPLFIHGGVGLGKTHLMHSIGHHILKSHRKCKVYYITTEAFINDLVDSLKNKSLDKLKRFYRSLDVLLVDDIQFLQNRMNFEEEFCNMFESLINEQKQIVITSDKPPAGLKLSERLVARMEWGLVAHIGAPDLETRVAILQAKAEQKGLRIPNPIAFFIAEHIFHNVRQLEGAINRLSAYCRLLNQDVTEQIVEETLGEMFQYGSRKKITVEQILKSVSSIFDVKISDLRSSRRNKEVAFPRQIAMYLAKEMLNESLMKLASAFGGKTHSTLLHAWKKIGKQLEKDENLRRQLQITKQNLQA